MYSILVDEDNKLIVTKKERIIQRSKLVDNLVICFKDTYKEIDMSEYSVMLEYILPTSKKYKSEKLTVVESERREGYLEATLPFDTSLTAEPGEIEMQVTFIHLEQDTTGAITQYVRKTTPCTIDIIPVSAWSDIVPDEALNAVDQAFIRAEALINQLDDLAQTINAEKADDIEIGEVDGVKSLYLKALGEQIGTPISLNDLGDEIAEDTEAGMINVITI